MRPEPTGVWLVREGDPTATEGTISIEDRGLTFEPDTGEALTIPFERLRRVRRRRGTPLLVVSLETAGGGATRLFFYFAKPPPLPDERSSAPSQLIKGPRGLERSAAALTLRDANRLLKKDIDAWVRALREAGAGA